MPFTYSRTIRFQDTDAAGVVYFANLLAICHEAYEASLEDAGIDLKLFFSNSQVAVPIVSASIDFFRPLFCGDRLLVSLTPAQLSEEKFEISYQIDREETAIAKALTQHACIDPATRRKIPLPESMQQWLHQWEDKLNSAIPSPKDI